MTTLKKLNLGIAVCEDVGYSKIGGNWGMTLRTYSGNQGDPDRDDVEQWLFNDAPRSLRLSAIGKIPELLDTLSVEASSSNTAKQVQAKLTEAKEVTAAVTEALNNFQGEAR